jgi:protein O-GlcNAc transferase
VKLKKKTAPLTFDAAVQHHRAGRLDHAEAIYRHVVEREPDNEQAVFLLAALCLGSARSEEAAQLLERAQRLAPTNAHYLSNLGEAYRRLGRAQEAADTLVKAVALRPELPEASYNLGLALRDLGELEAALMCFVRAADVAPERYELQLQLAEGLKRTGDCIRAVGHYQCALALDPQSLEALLGLAFCQRTTRRVDGAIAMARRAIAVAPQHPAGHYELGEALVAQNRQTHFDEAIASFQRSIQLFAADPRAHFGLGGALLDVSRVPEAIEHFRAALALTKDRAAHSNLVYCLGFVSDDARSLLIEARKWAENFARPFTERIRPLDNARDPSRRLRIGYVGPSFRDHCQAFFLDPLLRHHDHENFEIYCYASVAQPDKITERLLNHADVARITFGMDDVALAEQIRSDGIDVLIDLNMHMADARLLTFACRPAPVQICWLAYPGTTGLPAMDYRITDPLLDPPDSDLSMYSEQSIHLPDAFWCYDPLQDEAPEVSALPALASGVVTFGCLNALWKVTDRALRLWAGVLRAVPNSRFVVLTPVGEARTKLLAFFERAGIASQRIECVPRRARAEYLRSYGGIDLCLDTTPYSGHTTSLDAFWMGVPVLTLVGETVVGRAGLCQATLLGLPQLIAHSEQEYVERAVELTTNLEALAKLRAGLRHRLEQSPLMDGPRFAKNMEAAYRQVWQRWCRARAGHSTLDSQ